MTISNISILSGKSFKSVKNVVSSFLKRKYSSTGGCFESILTYFELKKG
jgi:hypothetical protein